MITSGTTFNPDTKIWSGPDLPPYFNPDISIGEVILKILSENPTKIAQICDNNGIVLTNEDIQLRAIRMAQHLIKSGYKQGDIVGVVCKHTTNLVAVVLAGFLCGTPVNAMDPTMDRGDFSITRPKVMFCDDDNYEKVSELMKEIDLKCDVYTVRRRVDGIKFVDDIVLVETGTEKYFVPPKLEKGSASSIAAILFSSGTTGASKAVTVSHHQIHQYYTIALEKTMVCLSSLHWVVSFMFMIGPLLGGGTRIITEETMTPELIFEMVEKYRAKYLFANTVMLRMMLQSPKIKIHDIGSLEVYFTTGSKVSTSDYQQMSGYLKGAMFCQGYGMTEIGFYAAVDYPESNTGSVGKLVPGAHMKILDDNGDQLGVGQNGEIFYKSVYKFLGYYKNGEITNNIMNEQGWLATGDIGHFDENGYLYIVDRAKDIFKYETYAINPSEIEDVITQIPDVKQVCVCDVKSVNERLLPAAVLIMDSSSKLCENDIIEYVEKNLLDYQRLRGGAYFVDTIPISSSGKIQRRKVRDIVQILYRKK